MNWMREIAEQNLNQSRVILENLLTITRKAVDDTDHQSSEFRRQSMLLAEATLSNDCPRPCDEFRLLHPE
jgi:hypothetical protein